MKVYELILPLAPTINHYYGARGSKRYIKQEGEEFRWRVLAAVKSAKIPLMTGRISISIRVYPRDKRMQDIDNRIKATLDALQHAGVFANDSQVDDLHVVRGKIIPGGRLELMIGEIE